jgi:beta-N-acetylhexosaminidase
MTARSFPSAESKSLREKIAQLIFVRVGSNMPPVCRAEADEERVRRLLSACPVGGLLLFNGGPDAAKTIERLQSHSAVPLLVGSDIERGVGQQVHGYALFPHAMAFDKLDADAPAAVADFARAVASEARHVGIHITFAPVADINTNPRNPIINTRAFSGHVSRATELTRAFVIAAEAAGLRTTAKHFPGHGDTEKDSHDSLPTIDESRGALEARELIPFRAAIDAGCSLMMTAHVSYPALDPSGAPATASPAILQQLLRGELGFRGVVCSDSLLMAGARDLFASEEDMSLAVLNAGVDLLLDLEDPGRVVDHLCKCVHDGSLDEQRVNEAFERVWALKQRVFADQSSAKIGAAELPAKSATKLAARIARDSVVVLGNGGPSHPRFKGDLPTAAILLKPFETAIEPLEQPLGAVLQRRFKDATYVQLGPKADSAAYHSARAIASTTKQLLVAIIVRPAAWHAFGLKAEQAAFVREIIASRNDVVLACLGVPSALEEFDGAATRICTYSDVPVSQEALVDMLIGNS